MFESNQEKIEIDGLKATVDSGLKVYPCGRFIDESWINNWASSSYIDVGNYYSRHSDSFLFSSSRVLGFVVKNEDVAREAKRSVCSKIADKLNVFYPLKESPLFSGRINYAHEIMTDEISIPVVKKGLWGRFKELFFTPEVENNRSRGKSSNYWNYILGNSVSQFSKNGEMFGSVGTVINDFNKLVNSNNWNLRSNFNEFFGERNLKLLGECFKGEQKTINFIKMYAAEESTTTLNVYRMCLIIAKIKQGINGQENDIDSTMRSIVLPNLWNTNEINAGTQKCTWASMLYIIAFKKFYVDDKKLEMHLVLSHGISKEALKGIEPFKDFENINLGGCLHPSSESYEKNLNDCILSLHKKTYDLMELFDGYSFANKKYKTYLLNAIKSKSDNVDLFSAGDRCLKYVKNFYDKNYCMRLDLNNFSFKDNLSLKKMEKLRESLSTTDKEAIEELQEKLIFLKNHKKYLEIIANEMKKSFIIRENTSIMSAASNVTDSELVIYISPEFCKKDFLKEFSRMVNKLYVDIAPELNGSFTIVKKKAVIDTITTNKDFLLLKEVILAKRLKADLTARIGVLDKIDVPVVDNESESSLNSFKM